MGQERTVLIGENIDRAHQCAASHRDGERRRQPVSPHSGDRAGEPQTESRDERDRYRRGDRAVDVLIPAGCETSGK